MDVSARSAATSSHHTSTLSPSQDKPHAGPERAAEKKSRSAWELKTIIPLWIIPVSKLYSVFLTHVPRTSPACPALFPHGVLRPGPRSFVGGGVHSRYI